MREAAAGGAPASTGGAVAAGARGSTAADPGGGRAVSASSERDAYEEELAKALASDEIRPWIAERILDEKALRAAATAAEAVRDAQAAAAEERARIRLLTDRIERLGARIAENAPRGRWAAASVTAVLGTAAAVLYVSGTQYPIAGLLVLSALASGTFLLSLLTGVIPPGTRAGSGIHELASEQTQANWRAMALHKELRRELREAKAERDAAEAAWRNALRERGILPRLRLEVNAALDGGASTTLVVQDRKSLGGPPDPARLVDPTAAPRLRRLIEEMPSATIAVAGPRGVGKTTLLHALCAGRYNRPDEPADLAVSLAAPVRYVPREFVLALFAATCQAVLADRGRGPARPAVPVAAPTRGRAAVRALPWLLLAGGTTLAAWPWLHRLALSARHHLTALGLMLIVAGAPWAVGRLTRRRQRRTAAPSLTDLAHEHLVRLRSVQSIAYGQTGTAALPLGMGGQLSRTLTVTTQAPTYPELVDDLRGFLTLLGRALHEEARRLIIAIDELDRIGDQAGEFIDELKAVFGVRNCFFLVSVADDLAAGFAGRRLPALNSLEGAFDEVVRMSFLTWRESRDLLQRRVIGLPTPFALLCHVLSGGVARELLRTTRRLLWTHDTTGSDRLRPLALLLAGADMAERLEAVRARARRAGPEHERLLLDIDRALRELDGVRPDDRRAVYGRIAASLRRDDGDVERDGGVAGGGFQDDEARTLGESIAVRSCFHLTVVDLFTTWGEDGFTTERCVSDVDELAALARACDTEPALGRRRLDELRRRHGLMPSPGPSDRHAGDNPTAP